MAVWDKKRVGEIKVGDEIGGDLRCTSIKDNKIAFRAEPRIQSILYPLPDGSVTIDDDTLKRLIEVYVVMQKKIVITNEVNLAISEGEVIGSGAEIEVRGMISVYANAGTKMHNITLISNDDIRLDAGAELIFEGTHSGLFTHGEIRSRSTRFPKGNIHCSTIRLYDSFDLVGEAHDFINKNIVPPQGCHTLTTSCAYNTVEFKAVDGKWVYVG